MCIYRYTCTALGISKTNAMQQNSWLGIYIELPITGFSNPGDMGNHNSRVCGIQTCPAFLLLCVPILGFSVVNCDVRYLLLGFFFFFFVQRKEELMYIITYDVLFGQVRSLYFVACLLDICVVLLCLVFVVSFVILWLAKFF